jgi:molybdate-binding protein/DNA-binding PadR family transcriptional regulator
MSPTLPLLGLLLRGDAYGYELKRMVETEFEPHWRIDFAQLYRSLAKLNAQGFVRVRAMPGEDGPPRKIYTATARGRRAFEEWIVEPAATQAEFWVKVRLATTLGYDADALVAAERTRAEAQRVARRTRQQDARAAGDAGQLVLHHAALRRAQAETDAVALAEVMLQTPSRKRARETTLPLLIVGSDDPLLAYLADSAQAVSQVMGSMAGLDALAAQQADAAGTHLRDATAHEYNISFVQHLIPEADILLVNLAVREYGLVVARGNPKNIRGVRDLRQRGVRLINRPRGAGARLWLYQHLCAAHLDPTARRDWTTTAATYDALAAAIENGVADVGPGLRVTAVQWGLDFIPLGTERFDLAMPRAVYESVRAEKLFDQFHSRAFRARAADFSGYDVTRIGRVVGESKFGIRRK